MNLNPWGPSVRISRTVLIVSIAFFLGACGGDDGDDGIASLVEQTPLAAGSSACFKGGINIRSGADSNGNGTLEAGEVADEANLCAPTSLNTDRNFNRIAYFPVCSLIDPNCNTDTETVAEIVAASSDGRTLIYTDSPRNQVGFVDITDPTSPDTEDDGLSLELELEWPHPAIAGTSRTQPHSKNAEVFE